MTKAEIIHGNHECSLCLKRFDTKSQLKEHNQIHPVTFKPQASSLADICEAKLFTQLAKLVSNESFKSVFAVGGVVALSHLKNDTICDSDETLTDNDTTQNVSSGLDKAKVNLTKDKLSAPAAEEDKGPSPKTEVEEKQSLNKHAMRCDPVTIRWDSTSAGGCKVTLPCLDTEKPAFEQLLKDCEPASFGRGGESVMDETYRKAGKLDSSAFSCNFNPYSLGLIDATAQALVPKLAQRTNESYGLRAELYKFNVMSHCYLTRSDLADLNPGILWPIWQV